MKAAIPIYNDEVAPRFGFADRFLVGEIDEHTVTNWEEVSIAGHGWPERLEEIRGMGIDTLLCCGFNRQFIPFSNTLGIHVITGLTGNGRDILEQFAKGNLGQGTATRRCTGNGRKMAHPRNVAGAGISEHDRNGGMGNGRRGQGKGQRSRLRLGGRGGNG